MVFSTFSMLCNHHLYLGPRHSSLWKENPVIHLPLWATGSHQTLEEKLLTWMTNRKRQQTGGMQRKQRVRRAEWKLKSKTSETSPQKDEKSLNIWNKKLVLQQCWGDISVKCIEWERALRNSKYEHGNLNNLTEKIFFLNGRVRSWKDHPESRQVM